MTELRELQVLLFCLAAFDFSDQGGMKGRSLCQATNLQRWLVFLSRFCLLTCQACGPGSANNRPRRRAALRPP